VVKYLQLQFKCFLSDDEGFIEIAVDPSSVNNDELFPAELFTADSSGDSVPGKPDKSVKHSDNTSSKVATDGGKVTSDPGSRKLVDADLKKMEDGDVETVVAEQTAKNYPEFNIGDYELYESENEDDEVLLPSGENESETEKSTEFKGMTVVRKTSLFF